MPEYSYLFGPVPSRRLGMSLGIDLVPHKVCTIDCVYCECGATTYCTTRRKEYVPARSVLQELEQFMQQAPSLDCLTFSGAGEPTLNSEIGGIIREMKNRYPHLERVLLTNGTLLYDPKVRADIEDITIAKISVDAVTDSVFQQINRPHTELSLEKIKKGIQIFSREFQHTIWLEYFLIPGLNDSLQELEAAAEFLSTVDAEKLQINTLDRPAPESWVRRGSAEALRKAVEILQARLPYPVLNVRKTKQKAASMGGNLPLDEIIQNLVSRRPMTAEDIHHSTARDSSAIEAALKKLTADGKIRARREHRGIFYETEK
ncbi:MAG: radical SAM protein [Fibrobacterota bacterium]